MKGSGYINEGRLIFNQREEMPGKEVTKDDIASFLETVKDLYIDRDLNTLGFELTLIGSSVYRAVFTLSGGSHDISWTDKDGKTFYEPSSVDGLIKLWLQNLSHKIDCRDKSVTENGGVIRALAFHRKVSMEFLGIDPLKLD